MSNILKSYTGYWNIPSFQGEIMECPGTLFLYENDGLILDIHHSENIGHQIDYKNSYDIIQGKEDSGRLITLENVVFNGMNGYVHTTLKARFALIGAHVPSFDTKVFSTAIVHFPYLRTWAFNRRVEFSAKKDIDILSVDMGKKSGEILRADIGNMDLVLWSSVNTHFTQFDYNIVQDTYLNLISKKKISINEFLKNTTIFSRFLTITLFKAQSPNSIKFKTKDKHTDYELLFKELPSTKALASSVIKFKTFKERLPEILKQWYANYDKVSPIAAYLSSSLPSSGTFDSPDFLLIVQALDGYFKRFKNKEDGIDTRKNVDALNKLIAHFDGVNSIRECNLDADVIVQTRDYYTHLLEKEDKPKAVTDSTDLIWLTEKCKILLTCCLLEYSGMTIAEINTCCEESPIKTSIYWIHSHENKKQKHIKR